MPNPEQYGTVKLKGILFGEDNWGTVLDEEAPYKNEKGIMMKRFLVIPGEHLMKQYLELQKPGALTYNNIALWVEYPTYWVYDTNPSRTNAIVRIDCGFDGRETSQTKRNRHFTEEIRTLREELENYQLSNIYLTEENRKLLGEKKQIIKDYMEMSEMSRGGGKRESDEEYTEREG